MLVSVGLVGKTNTGKTTFFNASTLSTSEISIHPFSTKKLSCKLSWAITPCVHPELMVHDNPINSKCVDGLRHVKIEINDFPGLIKDSWDGKGLGNQFLFIAAQSDVLLHVVDASGSIDSTGKICDPGTADPIADFAKIEDELIM